LNEENRNTNAKEKDMRAELQCRNEMETTNNRSDADQRPVIIPGKYAEVPEPPYSDPITMAQAKELIACLDEKCVELLRQIVLGDGSITWPQVQQICGIEGTDFGHYHYCYGEKIRQALHTITQGEHRYLITYEDGAAAWDTDDWKDARLEVDGPALMSLREVLAG
jgi:uncharacterized protein YheU (UPF0270 family)